jgi:hypothetical protein
VRSVVGGGKRSTEEPSKINWIMDMELELDQEAVKTRQAQLE